MTLFRRTRTFKVWLIDKAHVHRAGYKAASLPAVGETIFVRKMALDAEGSWRTMKAEPVPACVTEVRGGTITATTDPGAQLPEPGAVIS